MGPLPTPLRKNSRDGINTKHAPAFRHSWHPRHSPNAASEKIRDSRSDPVHQKKHPLNIQGKMAEQPVAEVFTFPTDPAQFENDDRISFSKLDNKYIAVQESDGTEFEFDAQLRRWIPLADEDEEALILQQQSAYGAASPSDTQVGNGKKRKQDEMEVSAHAGTVHLETPLHDSSTPVPCPHHPPCTMGRRVGNQSPPESPR